MQPQLSPEMLQAAYESRTLHVVTSAPRRDYATRISIQPEVETGGDYLGILLGWVGNRAYQHAALVRSAIAENSLGLGVLRSFFSIVRPWQGRHVHPVNVLKRKVHPSGAHMKSILKRRRLHLSPDQIRCLESISETDNSNLITQAYAGTGKTLMLGVVVEAALENEH